MSADFVLAPKTNLVPDGDTSAAVAPEWLQEWIVTEEELRATYDMRADFDFSNFFVCDGVVPLGRLGKRIKKISFEETATSMLANTGAARQQQN